LRESFRTCGSKLPGGRCLIIVGTEGGVLNELKTCGVQDILIAVIDGLKGFPEAFEAVFRCSRRQRYRPASCI
jgi:hypothetical protein